MVIWLALLFALVALAYASVGFGGGSTYNALLAISGVEYALVPIVALACNIVVVTGGTLRFALAGQYLPKKLVPLLCVSVPAAFLGGLVPLAQSSFLLLLGVALLLSAILLLLPIRLPAPRHIPDGLVLLASAVVGLVAGLSGIGGGIFFAPLLHIIGWDNPRRIAAFASLYILVNSIAGLAGQITKHNSEMIAGVFDEYWLLLIAVAIGGQIGGLLAVRLLSESAIRILTGIVVIYASTRLMWQYFSIT